jgi:hypothetical protein
MEPVEGGECTGVIAKTQHRLCAHAQRGKIAGLTP